MYDRRLIYLVLDNRVVWLADQDRRERAGRRMSKVQVVEQDGKPAFYVVPGLVDRRGASAYRACLPGVADWGCRRWVA